MACGNATAEGAIVQASPLVAELKALFTSLEDAKLGVIHGNAIGAPLTRMPAARWPSFQGRPWHGGSGHGATPRASRAVLRQPEARGSNE